MVIGTDALFKAASAMLTTVICLRTWRTTVTTAHAQCHSIEPMASDRGWNDPPMLSYQPTMTSRHILNRRPNEMPGLPPEPLLKPSTVSGPSYGQIPPTVELPPKGTTDNTDQPRDTVSCSETGNDVDLTHVATTLETVFEKTKTHLDKRHADDVRRRLEIFKRQWASGKLSKRVREEMSKLVAALEAGDGNTAHLIHVSLMVDHVAEVSQWMVGIKRLIVTMQKQQIMKDENVHVESNLSNGFNSASH